MKKLFLFSVLVCSAGFAQQQPKLSLTAPVPANTFVAPDFSAYSKNYAEVFGQYQYTFNTANIKYKRIYAAPDGNFYSLGDGRYVPVMPLAANTAYLYNFNSGDIVSGVVSALTGSNFNLSYTFKKKK